LRLSNIDNDVVNNGGVDDTDDDDDDDNAGVEGEGATAVPFWGLCFSFLTEDDVGVEDWLVVGTCL